MITFDDVRRTDKTTFTFFPDGRANELKHFLTLAGIPDSEYQILSYNETRARYPDMQIPAVHINPLLPDVPDAYTKKPILIISDMDPVDLLAKIHKIHASPDAKEWRRQLNQNLNALARKQLNYTDNWQTGKE